MTGIDIFETVRLLCLDEVLELTNHLVLFNPDRKGCGVLSVKKGNELGETLRKVHLDVASGGDCNGHGLQGARGLILGDWELVS